MPSGITVTSDAADLHAGAVRHQPGQRADPEAVARGAVRAGVGEEPAGHPEGQADDAGCRPRRRHRRAGPAAPAAGGGAGRGAARPPTGAELGSCGRQQRGHGHSIFTGGAAAYGAATPTGHETATNPGVRVSGRYRGAAMRSRLPRTSIARPAESRGLRGLLQGRPRSAAPADLRADRRPAGRGAGGPRRDGRGLAPLAQGLPARPARGLRPPAGLDPRPAAQLGPLVGPAEGPRRPTSAPPWTPSAS